jgi:hypothetical protein
MSDNLPPENEFLVKHGRNTTDRMAAGLLEAIADMLPGFLYYNGKKCRMKLLEVNDNKGIGTDAETGEFVLRFDIIDPDENFDHVEFAIRKTGWGRTTTATKRGGGDE